MVVSAATHELMTASVAATRVRCFGSWAKQFQINPKDPLIHVCIYGKVVKWSEANLKS